MGNPRKKAPTRKPGEEALEPVLSSEFNEECGLVSGCQKTSFFRKYQDNFLSNFCCIFAKHD